MTVSNSDTILFPDMERLLPHLPEGMAIQLAKHRTELLSENLHLYKVSVNDDGVQMPLHAAFEFLHQHDHLLWENVIDAFIDIAQEMYLEHCGIDASDDHYLEGGIDFEDGMINVNRE